jgi:hypothetical protein
MEVSVDPIIQSRTHYCESRNPGHVTIAWCGALTPVFYMQWDWGARAGLRLTSQLLLSSYLLRYNWTESICMSAVTGYPRSVLLHSYYRKIGPGNFFIVSVPVNTFHHTICTERSDVTKWTVTPLECETASVLINYVQLPRPFENIVTCKPIARKRLGIISLPAR